MPRIDDYQQALDLAKKELATKDPEILAGFAGGIIGTYSENKKSFSLRFLNKEISCNWPELVFSKTGDDKELTINEQILILHYLQGAWASKGQSTTGEWVGYQDIPDGRFYLDAFVKRAKNPLIGAFGMEPEKLIKLANMAYGAEPFEHGDGSVIVNALPLVPVSLIIWRGDDEFPPDGNLLFDKNIAGLLSAEDVAWLAGMIVYPLMGMVKGVQATQ